MTLYSSDSSCHIGRVERPDSSRPLVEANLGKRGCCGLIVPPQDNGARELPFSIGFLDEEVRLPGSTPKSRVNEATGIRSCEAIGLSRRH